MTKTLTEQWREGTLPEGWYYIRLEPNFENRYDIVYNFGIDFDLYNTEDIEEVLAPVPSYDEYKRLQEQLKEANKVIKKYAYPKSVCKSRTENQEVWEVIAYTEPKEGLDYLDKWGVK